MNRNDYKILIVDDMPENIQVLKANLTNYGYQIGFATNGYDCLKVCTSAEFDLVLLDIMMPGLDGFEVLKILRSQPESNDIPIIFVTAKTDEESIVKGLRLGAQDYVTKPFNSEELRSRIDTHIQLHNAKKQVESMNVILEQKVHERTIELEKANLELSHLEEAKSYFLSLLAHELNTPLSVILGSSNMVYKYSKDKRVKELCETINEAGTRLKRFSDISLLITDLKSSNYSLNLVDYPISDIINSVVYQLDDIVQNKNLKIISNINDDNIRLGFDPVLIREVFLIILENSVKHSDDNTDICIDSIIEEDHFIIHFTDIGPGFSEKALKNVFKEFASDEIMQHKEGKGLGLVAANLIIKAHNGIIVAENLPHKGAKVSISLPIIKG